VKKCPFVVTRWCIDDTEEFLAVEGPQVCSENENRGGLELQKSERFYL
jgi:hypothetical protein